MVNVRVDLSKRADKNLEGFMYMNSISNKASAIIKILEELNLKEDMLEWLEEGDSNE